MMADMAIKKISVSSANKSLTFVVSKKPNVSMVKTWKELRVESHALALRWTMNVITVTLDPLLELVSANWIKRLIVKFG